MLSEEKIKELVTFIRKEGRNEKEWGKLLTEIDKMSLEELNELCAGIAFDEKKDYEQKYNLVLASICYIFERKADLFVKECLSSSMSEKEIDRLLKLMKVSFSITAFLRILTDKLEEQIKKMPDSLLKAGLCTITGLAFLMLAMK